MVQQSYGDEGKKYSRYFFVMVTTFALAGTLARAQQAPASQTASKPAAAQAAQKPQGKAFGSPDQAASELAKATQNNDEQSLIVILGPNARDIVNWTDDNKEKQEERQGFVRKYNQMHRLVKEPDGTVTLYVGAENWPLPIPLMEINGKWYFDTDLARREILYRRIGRNELEALEVCHALVDAEKSYHADEHAYTAKFVSDGNSKDGLYWPSAGGKSPIGPLLAHAGINNAVNSSDMPFHGYFYRIVLAKGANGSGDAFSVVAFPAGYRSSGVMTFVVDQNGNAYEKDLGPMTAARAEQINSLAATSTWKKEQ